MWEASRRFDVLKRIFFGQAGSLLFTDFYIDVTPLPLLRSLEGGKPGSFGGRSWDWRNVESSNEDDLEINHSADDGNSFFLYLTKGYLFHDEEVIQAV